MHLHFMELEQATSRKKNKNKKPQLAVRAKNQGKGKSKLAYAPKPKITPPSKRENHAKDSGASTSGLRGSRNLKPRALSLYMGNGQRAVVEAIGSYDLCFPSGLVDYALESAACILNMVPTKKVKKTLYEIWHGQAPKLSYLKVWGCEALVKRDTLTKTDKLEPRSIKCIFIGYPTETMGYSFYYPPENKILVARNVEFLENNIIAQEASESLKDLEIIQEEDTHPSE
ncbi:retrovirus-related pol polyprotein from transposon TNT 1-94, partial [Tanacetum coccineum]